MTLPRIGGFDAPPGSDYAAMTYDESGNLTVVTYKVGGESGQTTGVLNITYDGTNVATVYWS
jgi:hypothetical protein